MTDVIADSPRSRWLRRSAVGCASFFAIIAVFGLLLRGCLMQLGSRQIKEYEAAADEADPGWRWEQVIKNREAVPDGENASLRILAAAKLLPKNWPAKPAVALPDRPTSLDHSLQARLQRTEPPRRLPETLAADLRAELKALAPSVAEAMPVADLPRGRYEITWTRNPYTTLLPHAEKVRNIGELLALDVALRTQEGDDAGTLTSWRALLNSARSLGDEPLLISQLVRIALTLRTVEALERVLAQSSVPAADLTKLSRLLQNEEEQAPGLLRKAMRAERAAIARVLELAADGEINMNELELAAQHREDTFDKALGWTLLQPLALYGKTPTLELMDRHLDSLSLPPGERRTKLDSLERELKQSKADIYKHPEMIWACLLLPAVNRVVTAFDREQAVLRCARVALALERYRQSHATWPEKLDLLVPDWLGKLPEDPFGAGTLRYRRLPDGVVVYSVGDDGKDDGGAVRWDNWSKPGTDIGFRLWDPGKRKQPALAEKPSDN